MCLPPLPAKICAAELFEHLCRQIVIRCSYEQPFTEIDNIVVTIFFSSGEKLSKDIIMASHRQYFGMGWPLTFQKRSITDDLHSSAKARKLWGSVNALCLVYIPTITARTANPLIGGLSQCSGSNH